MGRPSENLMLGSVADLDDPEQLGRIRVRFPSLGDQLSAWARLSTPMAGGGRGTFFRPEVGDEVVVAFELGDPTRPFVLGSLWSSADKPPPDDGRATQNNHRLIQSRSGHILRFDDTAGKERLEFIASDGQRRVVLDSAKQEVVVECDSGNVVVKAAQGTVTVEAMKVEIKAQAGISIQAGGTLELKGATVNIN
jgi:uncharacterized protein involved in type VI secretion and phage assembly